MSSSMVAALSCRVAVAALVLTLMAACADSPQKLIASARDYAAEGDDAAAVIQLRNALQKDAQLGEARLLLGQALLRQGDPVSAEKELRRALDFGQPISAVAVDLARAMHEAGQIEPLLKQFSDLKLDDPRQQAALLAVLGDTRMRIGKVDEARANYAAALIVDPSNLLAQLGQAVLAQIDGQTDEALAGVDRVLASDPRLARAHAMRHDLLLFRGEAAEAKKSLLRALDADPRFTAARLALVSVLIRDGEFDEAARQIEAGRKASRGDSRLILLDATLSLHRGDRAAARDKVQQVLKVAPDHVPSLLIAGQVELADGNFGVAQQHLRRALNRAPGSEPVRRALTASFLRGGQPARALETLQPLLTDQDQRDGALLLLAGETYLASGDLKQATVYFDLASKGEDVKAAARTRLGQIALASGDAEAGVRQLAEATAIGGADYQADLTLITAHLRRKELDKAEAAAHAFEKRQPQNPLSHHMLGLVAGLNKDNPAARKHFDRALELAPAYLPSLSALAGMDFAEGRPEDARKRFERLIEREPKNEAGYLGLAEVQARTGASRDEIMATLRRAISAAPHSLQASVSLVQMQIAAQDPKGAVTTAQAAAATLPDEPRVLEALARAQDAAGDYNQAVEAIQKTAKLQPESPEPWQKLAALHLKHRQFDRALDALRRAQQLAPANSAAAAAIAASSASTLVLAGRVDEALKESRALQVRAPKLPVGHAIEAEVHAANGDWGAAERALRAGLKLAPQDPRLAVRLHAALAGGGKSAEAAGFARSWLADNARDSVFRSYLADRALRSKDYRAAMGLYQQMIGITPDNAVVLNNLAWVAGELGDLRALDWARRAHELAPDSAPILDTLGVLLVRKGDTKRGLEYLERARRLAPERADLHLHHAQALITAGQRDLARKELQALLQRAGDLPEKVQAGSLLKSL